MSSVTDKLNTAASIAARVAGFARDNNVISKGLSMIGQDKAAEVARALGAGRRKKKGKKAMPPRTAKGRFVKRHAVKGGAARKKRSRRTQRGGSIFGRILGTIGQAASSVPLAALGAVGGLTQGLSGLGRKRRSPRLHQRGGFAVNMPYPPKSTYNATDLHMW